MFGEKLMPIRAIISTLIVLTTLVTLQADDRALLREPRPLDPDSTDVVGQFHQVGYPKYTDIERRVIDRAQKLQDEHTAIFNKIEIGKSVFDYPGLIALGVIRYDQGVRVPYILTVGVRPHLSEFAGSFGEYRVEFDAKGVVQSKSKVRYSWNKDAEQ